MLEQVEYVICVLIYNQQFIKRSHSNIDRFKLNIFRLHVRNGAEQFE